MGSYQIPERQEEINWLFREFLAEPESTQQVGTTVPNPRATIGASRTAQEAAELLCKDPQRRAIFEGGNLDYDSDSEADGRLFYNLAFFCEKDVALMREVAELSARRRPKWYEKRRHTDWLGWELEKAAERQTETIGPKREASLKAKPERNGSGDLRRNSLPMGDTEDERAPTVEGRILLGRDIRDGIDPPDELVEGVLLCERVHSIHAGAGMGKTWMMLWIVLQVIEQGLRVILFDMENGRRIIAERLKQLGADPEKLDELLHYYSAPSLDPVRYEVLLEEVEPALVVFDSWINFLASDGLDENVSNDIASWAVNYTHPARNRGSAVLLLDHVPKEGQSSRGSGRKKDEVDVQWSLRNPFSFDRDMVGRLILHREKDREGWLPQDIGFSVGGGDAGFVFERSSGTVEVPAEDGLKPSESKALEALRGMPEMSATTGDWEKRACTYGVKRRSFYSAKKTLVHKMLVLQEENTYTAWSAEECKDSANALLHSGRDASATGAPPLRGAPDCTTAATRCEGPVSYDLEPGESSTVGELWEQRQKDIDRALDDDGGLDV